jgi:predicted GNAT family N-acyltransferase
LLYQVVDIVVLPESQGRGLGKRIVHEIMAYGDANVPDSGNVGLTADGRAQHLYAQFDFVSTGHRGVGMAQKWPRRSGT